MWLSSGADGSVGRPVLEDENETAGCSDTQADGKIVEGNADANEDAEVVGKTDALTNTAGKTDALGG